MTARIFVTVLLAVGLFASGFFLGRFTALGPLSVGPLETGDAARTSTETNTGTTATNTPGSVTVSASDLTEGQRAMLRSLGINPDTVVITPAMIACAEAELGVARMNEIKNGATPSFSEGVKLLACYRQ